MASIGERARTIAVNPGQREAENVTNAYFGRRRRVFSPIYLGNKCIMDCSYCGYRLSNRSLVRTSLSPEEAGSEAKFLVEQGVSYILLLAGELPEPGFLDWFARCLAAVKATKGVQWVGVELAALSEAGYSRLVDSGADAFIIFQESYDKKCYEAVHTGRGNKVDFQMRYEAPFKAAEAGFREIGLGVLLGLAPPDEEVDAMIQHGMELGSAFPDRRIRFSFPRFRPAEGALIAESPVGIDEEVIRRGVIKTRLSVPASRIALTSRESIRFRISLADLVTDFGAGGSTAVGGYGSRNNRNLNGQFRLLEPGTAPSFIHALEVSGLSVNA